MTISRSKEAQSAEAQSAEAQSTEAQSTEVKSTEAESTEVKSTDVKSTETESTESQKIDLKAKIIEIEERIYKGHLADLESFKKIFEKMLIGDSEKPGFNTLNENFKKLGAKGLPVDAHLSFKRYLNYILNKIHDSEKHEYNFHELNFCEITQDGENYIDELIRGLNHLNKLATDGSHHMEDFPVYCKHDKIAGLSIDVCDIASRTIDEINRFITKIQKHITKPNSSPTLTEWAYLFTIPFKDRRPSLLENDQIDMFKTYLGDLTERLEKIKLSVFSNLVMINDERVESKNKTQGVSRISFLNEKKQGDSVSPHAEEKQQENSFKL